MSALHSVHFRGVQAKKLQRNQYCHQTKVYKCQRKLQDYLNPILDLNILQPFMARYKQLFLTVWAFLTSTYGVNNGVKKTAHLVGGKSWLFKCFSNYYHLQECPILTTCFGSDLFNPCPTLVVAFQLEPITIIGDMCAQIHHIIGVLVAFSRIFSWIKLHICLNSRECLIIVFDNYEKSQHLWHQRGDHSLICWKVIPK